MSKGDSLNAILTDNQAAEKTGAMAGYRKRM